MLLLRLRYFWDQNRPRIDFKIRFDLIISVLLLLALLAILGSSLVRKIEESSRNYGVYLAEQAALETLKAENSKLKSELDYYSSMEYKLLFARDSLNKARPGEKIYEVAGEVELHSVQGMQTSLYPQLELERIWQSLLFANLL